jgi:hypothetical protein
MTTYTVFLTPQTLHESGFTPTLASNGATYYYQYTGGNTSANNGAIDVPVGTGRVTINITLSGSSIFKIQSIAVSGDTGGQLTYEIFDNTHAAIYDMDTRTESAYYKVNVTDTTANCTFPCDPPIVNEP